jgi:membrane dipeptidase
MRRLLPLLLALAACRSSADHDDALLERAHALAQRYVIVDGHIDTPSRLHGQSSAEREDPGRGTAGEFDLPRARAGGLDAPFMSIYTSAELGEPREATGVAPALIDLVVGRVRAHPGGFTIARTAAEVRAAKADGKVALLLGMENGSPIEDDLANLDRFHARGVRYVTLCHGGDNLICDSSYDERHTHSGLTRFGRQVVRRMNELGILVDVSHVSDDAFWQVLDVTRAPVIASHSSLRHFVPGFERNMSDDMVQAVGANGGVVMINFGSSFLTWEANQHGEARRAARDAFMRERGLARGSDELRELVRRWDREHPFPYATVSDAADHVERAVRLAGIDHVGFGSDFDGVGDSLPTGLKDVSMYPNLIAELLRRGFSDRDVEKICGANLLRVLARAEEVARELSGRR